jgi:hypothetical protein
MSEVDPKSDKNDLFRLNESDLSVLESGMNLIKLNPTSKELDSPENNRFFKIDLDKNELVASTKEFLKKEKICTNFETQLIIYVVLLIDLYLIESRPSHQH